MSDFRIYSRLFVGKLYLIVEIRVINVTERNSHESDTCFRCGNN